MLLSVFLLTLALQHVLQPSLPPETHRISEYATGSPGWLMTAGFVAWSGALFSTAAVASRSPLRPRGATHAMSAALLAAAVGAAATASFKTGTSAGMPLPGHRLTTANHIHDVGSGGLALALWGAAFVSLRLSDRRLRAQSAWILGCGVLAAVLLSGSVLDVPGLRQRALVVVACAWQGLLLSAVRRSWRSLATP